MYGIPGHLNFALRFGWVILKIKTDNATKTNAANVPMLVSSATVRIGVNAAISPEKSPVIKVEIYGVLYLG